MAGLRDVIRAQRIQMQRVFKRESQTLTQEKLFPFFSGVVLLRMLVNIWQSFRFAGLPDSTLAVKSVTSSVSCSLLLLLLYWFGILPLTAGILDRGKLDIRRLHLSPLSPRSLRLLPFLVLMNHPMTLILFLVSILAAVPLFLITGFFPAPVFIILFALASFAAGAWAGSSLFAPGHHPGIRLSGGLALAAKALLVLGVVMNPEYRTSDAGFTLVVFNHPFVLAGFESFPLLPVLGISACVMMIVRKIKLVAGDRIAGLLRPGRKAGHVQRSGIFRQFPVRILASAGLAGFILRALGLLDRGTMLTGLVAVSLIASSSLAQTIGAVTLSPRYLVSPANRQTRLRIFFPPAAVFVLLSAGPWFASLVIY